MSLSILVFNHHHGKAVMTTPKATATPITLLLNWNPAAKK
jgi:hypothetical protein